MIGAYGPWAASLVGDEISRFSFRNPAWTDLAAWRDAALPRFRELIAETDTGDTPQATVLDQRVFDGLEVEELSWQLPYGPPTEAVFLKPEGATGMLPGLLALHDHGGNKYFGKRKISQVTDEIHPVIVDHRERAYDGLPWANELARRGYGVLIHDAFPFASRRVRVADVPEHLRAGLVDDDPEREDNVLAYNKWAGEHESVMAKSLFCAGTTWPGVFLAEDRAALNVLCARDDVDSGRVGCGGLSGGGMRTTFLGGTDERIKCAACVGLMSTWRDYLLHKSHTHTWMCYVPGLPRDLDYPEILGLRVPLPTLVQNNDDDPLFTLPEMKRADDILGEVFEKAGSPERYRCSFYPGDHKFDVEMQAEAFDWFDQWLKA